MFLVSSAFQCQKNLQEEKKKVKTTLSEKKVFVWALNIWSMLAAFHIQLILLFQFLSLTTNFHHHRLKVGIFNLEPKFILTNTLQRYKAFQCALISRVLESAVVCLKNLRWKMNFSSYIFRRNYRLSFFWIASVFLCFNFTYMPVEVFIFKNWKHAMSK